MKFWQHDENGNLTMTGGQLRAARRGLGLDYEQMASLLNLRMQKPENRRRAIVRLENGRRDPLGGALVTTLVLAVEKFAAQQAEGGKNRSDWRVGTAPLPEPKPVPKPTPKPAPAPDIQPPAVSDDPEERREAEAERVRQRLRTR